MNFEKSLKRLLHWGNKNGLRVRHKEITLTEAEEGIKNLYQKNLFLGQTFF